MLLGSAALEELDGLHDGDDHEAQSQSDGVLGQTDGGKAESGGQEGDW